MVLAPSFPAAHGTPDPAAHLTGRAVVLGGSLTRLLAASVLARHVGEILVVDRDDLDVELTAPGRGVPQSRHIHGLLVRGLRTLDELLPACPMSSPPAARSRPRCCSGRAG